MVSIRTLLPLLALVTLQAPAASATPQPTYPALAVLRDPAFIPVSLTGSSFGAPGATAKLSVQNDTAPAIDISSTTVCNPPSVPDTCIVFWSSDWITAKLPPTYTRARVRITADDGSQSEFIRAQYWAYDFFDTDPNAAETNTNPEPHSVVVDTLDPQRSVWVGEEFHLAFKRWTAAGGVVKRDELFPTTPPFGSTIFPGPVNTSQSRQQVMDPYGRVWLSETGQPFYAGTNPNHARIHMFALDGSTRVYNIPGDHSALIGIAYEKDYVSGHDRVWYTVGNRQVSSTAVALPARVGWFDVDATSPCVAGHCQLRPATSCSNDTQCPLWSDGTGPFDPVAACAPRTCNDINFPGQVCTADTDCMPRCVNNQCLFGKPGSCTQNADCAPQCGGGFVCLNGNGTNCFSDPNGCVPHCGTGTCADDPARGCILAADCYADTLTCAGTDASAACRFHEYPLPNDSQVTGYIAVGRTPGTTQSDGTVWIADYIGQFLRRLDVASGTVTSYPLGDDPTLPPGPWFLGSNPFGIHVASNGDAVVAEYSDATLNRFNVSLASHPECLSAPAPSFQNPCATSLTIPSPAGYTVHSIGPDARENTWFGTEGPIGDRTSRGTVGYVKRDWKGIVMLPPLSLYPFDPSTVPDGENIASYCSPSASDPDQNFRSFRGNGIGVDTGSEQVFVADYCRKRLGRLQPRTYDLALGRPATQVGQLCFQGVCGAPTNATDGNVDGVFADGSVSHSFDLSGAYPQPWWQVDLGDSYPIEEIELWNRTDCCSTRLQNLYVFVADEDFGSSDPAVVQAKAGVTTITYPGTVGVRAAFDVARSGRFVRVQLAGTGQPLSLAEVVVLGSRCSSAAQCDDQVACTADTCDVTSPKLGACVHTCGAGACSVNGDPCGGTCQGVSGSCQCVAN